MLFCCTCVSHVPSCRPESLPLSVAGFWSESRLVAPRQSWGRLQCSATPVLKVRFKPKFRQRSFTFTLGRSNLYSLKMRVVILTFLFHDVKIKENSPPKLIKKNTKFQQKGYFCKLTVKFCAGIPSTQWGCQREVKLCDCSVEGRMSLCHFLVSSWEWLTAPGWPAQPHPPSLEPLSFPQPSSHDHTCSSTLVLSGLMVRKQKENLRWISLGNLKKNTGFLFIYNGNDVL